MIDDKTHRLLSLFAEREGRVLRVEFCHGPVFLLKVKYPLDTSIYGEPGGWNSDVVSMISDPTNKFHRPGNGLDFYEDDIIRIVDESKGDVIFDNRT